jgi:DNA (cytosine-5)-methyltransferase 1
MPYPVIDIFAGPGGLGEGFSSYAYNDGNFSFKNVLSIEKDASAHRTLYLRSFFRQFDPSYAPAEYWQYVRGETEIDDLLELYPKQAAAASKEALCLELGDTTYNKVKSLISDRIGNAEKWVLVGGPPCQAYSLAGRSRMRSTNPDFESDERHFLYLEYLKILADHAPPVFVMENVKGLLSATHSGEKIIHKIMDDLKNPGKALNRRKQDVGYNLFSLCENKDSEDYDPEDFIIKCEQFGIPQARHRLLILGIRSDISITPDVLTPQKAPSVQQIIGDLPKIRSTLSKEEDSLKLWKEIIKSSQQEKWYMAGKANGLLQTTLKIDEAITDLKDLNFSSGGEVIPFKSKPKIYADWYRDGSPDIILNHTARGHMRSDIHRYLFASSYAQANGKSPNLSNFPKALLPEHKNIEGKIKDVSFADRFRVQVKDKPSTTITSHISKDGHYFIHYDPAQCRSLTVREAARLQTFPDSYKFEGNRTSQYHQVGNAVPPLLAKQIAEIVYEVLRRIRL